MQIVKAGHEHISKKGMSPYQFVERIGRVCYKSEDKITETSAKDFVKGLVSRGHTAMIEHFWVHLTFTGSYNVLCDQIEDFVWNRLKDAGSLQTFFKFMQITYLPDITYISFPIRAVVDLVHWATSLNGSKELDEKCPPLIREMFYEVQSSYFDFFGEKAHIFSNLVVNTYQFAVMNEDRFIDSMKRHDFSDIKGSKDTEIMKHATHTFIFKCNRGVSHELVRHRPLVAFAQESTRYCNYSKSKFGNEITVIEPQPVLYNDGMCDLDYQRVLWLQSCEFAEKQYFKLLKAGATPQEARGVLPNDLKTEIVLTTHETEWQHIVNLRSKQTTGKAHPQMVDVMTPVFEELKALSDGRIF